MRSKKTNYLQVAVLLTGIVYIVAGALFAINPPTFTKLLPIPVIDDWMAPLKQDGFLSVLVSYERILSIMLFFAGFSMIMPLFDPLKYRGMIYMYGVFAPLASAVFSGFQVMFGTNVNVLCFLVSFSMIAVLNLSGLLATKKEAGMGVE